MKLYIKIKPGAKQNLVERVDDAHWRVIVKAPPTDGRANEALLEVLSEYFDRPKSRFRIVSGHQSRNKIVEVL